MSIGTDLKNTIRGRILSPGEDDFDAARRPWNLAVDQPVAAVVEAEDADDVAALVRYAGDNGLSVATQPNGHGATGDTEGAILLRTRRLDDVEVKPERRWARVGAGAPWAKLLAAAGPHGLTGLAGGSPVPSVVGYTLGGGLSWFGRRYGLAANSVQAFDVITANGDRSRVDAQSNPDLFWALRGGGGDYAIVTAMEVDLHPAPHLYGGRMLWPATHANEVMAAFQEATAEAPEELTVWFNLVQVPDLPHLPAPLRGRSLVTVDSTYLGEPDEAQTLLSPFDKIPDRILDNHRILPVAELGDISAEPTDPSPGMSRAETLTSLDDKVAGTILESVFRNGTVAPLVSVQIRHLGGALARPHSNGGACGHIAADYLLYAIGIPPTPGIGERQSEISAALGPHTVGHTPYTYLSPRTQTAADAFPTQTLARLRQIKHAQDPNNVLRANFPISLGDG